MPKESISKTAQVNLQMLAELGVPEALAFAEALGLEGNPLGVLSDLPFAKKIPLCVSTISEVLYERANDLILQAANPAILDIACGYSPRVLLMAPKGYTYIGADLPDVTNDLASRRNDIVPADSDWIAAYRTVDATDREQMMSVMSALREPLTIVTQGLLSYLTLEQKLELATSIKGLLARDGGCWIIPDTNASSLLPDTFEAILGGIGGGLVVGIYRTLDKLVGRDRSKMGWQTTDEMAEALEELGFIVDRMPLWHKGMSLRCLEQLDHKAAERLIASWEQKSSLVVRLP